MHSSQRDFFFFLKRTFTDRFQNHSFVVSMLLLHFTDGIGQVSGAWFPPDVTLGIEAKSHNEVIQSVNVF